MNGLRAYERDLSLPRSVGDGLLCPPSAEELLELVREGLWIPGSPGLREASPVYARWKPGTSIMASSSLIFSVGAGLSTSNTYSTC